MAVFNVKTVLYVYVMRLFRTTFGTAPYKIRVVNDCTLTTYTVTYFFIEQQCSHVPNTPDTWGFRSPKHPTKTDFFVRRFLGSVWKPVISRPNHFKSGSHTERSGAVWRTLVTVTKAIQRSFLGQPRLQQYHKYQAYIDAFGLIL